MRNGQTPFLFKLDEGGSNTLGHIAPFIPAFSRAAQTPGDPYPDAFRLPSLPLPLLMRVSMFNRRMAFPRVVPAPKTFSITGTTRDSAGVALGNCVVHLFRTSDDLEMDQVNSDSAGLYTFSSNISPTLPYYAVAYKAGSPDVAGTTRNDLVGT